MTNTPIEFETRRLLLRQWSVRDRDPWAALNADSVVMAHFPSVLTREQSDALAQRCQMFIEERGWGPWAVEVKTTAAFVSVARSCSV